MRIVTFSEQGCLSLDRVHKWERHHWTPQAISFICNKCESGTVLPLLPTEEEVSANTQLPNGAIVILEVTDVKDFFRKLKTDTEKEAGKILADIGLAEYKSQQLCGACQQKNGVIRGRKNPRCGKCGFPLKEDKVP